MLYDNLDTDRIERVELQIIALNDGVDSVQNELREYLKRNERFQHNPPHDVPPKHRRPTLYEYLGTLRLNSLRLGRTLSRLQCQIERGSDGVNDVIPADGQYVDERR